ncbi:MAG: beta-N-acetylhexosaminidase [Treponemataceae bacterium]|nr:beta-N-acetylhexosaminidase [Treponemataceae bacterium]
MKSEIEKLGLVPQPNSVELTNGSITKEKLADFFRSLPETLSAKASDSVKKEIQKDESYELEISSDSVKINADSEVGAFYAAQTIRQLLMNDCESYPCMTIKDSPAYGWRGFMLDVSRNFYPVAFIKKILDSLALHKMNRFHWHLTDDQGWRFNVPEFPKLTEVGSWRTNIRGWTGYPPVGGLYSDEEIAEVVQFAAERGIMVVPEVETPGHASAVLASYPELGCTGGPYHVEDRHGIFEDVLCAGNDKVFETFGTIFDTVCRLFPGPFVHIGGDECPRVRWEKCPKCAARMKALGLTEAGQLQSFMTVRMAKMLDERGKIPVGWDEVLDGTEKMGLPESLIVQSWRGIKGGEKAAELGHKVIMSPNTAGCYLDYAPYKDPCEPGNLSTITVKQSYDYSPVTESMGQKEAGFVLGGQGNLWSEVIYAPKIAEYMIYPRLSAIAESLWMSPENKDFESFEKRLEIHKKRLSALNFIYYNGPNA